MKTRYIREACDAESRKESLFLATVLVSIFPNLQLPKILFLLAFQLFLSCSYGQSTYPVEQCQVKNKINLSMGNVLFNCYHVHMNNRERAEAYTRYVGLELKGAIIARGFSATQVATLAQRSPAAFNRWLNGKVEIPLTVVCQACEVIGIEPVTILKIAYDRLCVEHGEADGTQYNQD